jgi:hypothetical protein
MCPRPQGVFRRGAPYYAELAKALHGWFTDCENPLNSRRNPQIANLRLSFRGSTGQAPDSLTADLKAYLFGLVENAVKQYRTIWHNAKPGQRMVNSSSEQGAV